MFHSAWPGEREEGNILSEFIEFHVPTSLSMFLTRVNGPYFDILGALRSAEIQNILDIDAITIT